ncbi:MAG TPA: response regulator transcription factor [Drouetiella sp.]
MNTVTSIRGINLALVSQIEVNPQIGVMVVSDCEISLAGLRTILRQNNRVDIVAESGSLQETIMLCGKFKPEIVVLSVSESREAICNAAEKIVEASKSTKIIVLNKSWSVAQIADCVARGIYGFITPPNPASCLAVALESVSRGCLWIGPNLLMSSEESEVSNLFGGAQNAKTLAAKAKLSVREAEIADLVAQGLSNRAIAQVLVITVDTVKSHLHHIMNKLEVRDRTQLAMKLLPSISTAPAANFESDKLASLPSNVRLRAS